MQLAILCASARRNCTRFVLVDQSQPHNDPGCPQNRLDLSNPTDREREPFFFSADFV